MIGKSVISRNVRSELQPVEQYAKTVIGLLFVIAVALVILVVRG